MQNTCLFAVTMRVNSNTAGNSIGLHWVYFRVQNRKSAAGVTSHTQDKSKTIVFASVINVFPLL